MRGFFLLVLIYLSLFQLPTDAKNYTNASINKELQNNESLNLKADVIPNSYNKQETSQSCKFINSCQFENTTEGYMALGDLAIKNKDYTTARNNYFKALQLDSDNLVVKNKLAKSYRLLGQINYSTRLYCEVLDKDPNNIEAKIGLGYLEIDKKNFAKSRQIFCEILEENPLCKSAQLGIVHSYLANGDNLKALEILKKMPADADVKLMKTKIYYNLGMYSDAFNNIPSKQECESCPIDKITKNRTNKNKRRHRMAVDYSKIIKLSEILKDKEERNSKTLKTISDESEPKVTSELPESHLEMEIESPGAAPVGSSLYTIPSLPSYAYPTAVPERAKTFHATVYENAQDLKYKIKRTEAITLTPSYSFLFQQLADEFDLDYHKFGIQMSKWTDGNKNVFIENNIIVYSSGHVLGGSKLDNVTNELRGGVQARPSEKWEYRADLGVKAFQFGNGAMLITDSWIKHYFSDKFNLNLGYRRNNIEQSYLSAVGEPVNGVFTGRAADNKIYLEFERKLPYGFYSFGRGSYGIICAQNLPTNQYTEGMLGIGKLLYNNPKNKWINTFGVDIVSYNSAYQYNLLNIYNNAGKVFGGYFSPSYFNATTANLKLEGEINKWHLKYGIKGFGGIQTAMSPDSTTPAWGFSPYVSYDLNDNICINLAYNHFNYASVQRDQFMINAVIRGFRKHA